MKRPIIFLGMIWILVFCFSISAGGADIDFGTYQVKIEKWGCKVLLPDGRVLINRFFPQIHLPKGVKGHTYHNFKFKKPVVEKEDNRRILIGSGIFKKTVSEAGININANIEMTYKIIFSPEGKISLHYEFFNNGDEVFLEPYVNADVNYDLCKGETWEVKKVQGQTQKGKWPEKIIHGIKSVDWSRGKPVELQIISATLNTKLGKPIIYNLSSQTHLRVVGGGRITLYNFKHFAGVYTNYNWKPFQKKEKFSIDAEIILPVGSAN